MNANRQRRWLWPLIAGALAMVLVWLLSSGVAGAREVLRPSGTIRDRPRRGRGGPVSSHLDRDWRLLRNHIWLAALALVGLNYAVVYWALPRLELSPSAEYCVARPLLWLPVGMMGLAGWLWAAAPKPGFANRAVLLGGLIGTYQVACLVLAGAFVGMGHSPYASSLAGLLQNAVYAGSTLLGMELARACVVSSLGRWNALGALAFTAVVFAAVTLPPGRYSNLADSDLVFSTSGGDMLPALAESLMAGVLAMMGGPLASVAYRGVLEGFRWFSPVLPDLPWGVAAFTGTLSPALALVLMAGLLSPSEKEERVTSLGRAAGAVSYAAALLIVSFLWLSSGLLGVRPSLVAGVSMEPTLQAGDVVITRSADPSDIRVGDIVRFENGGIAILHRVVDIYEAGSTTWVVTKGDNNNHPDNPVPVERIDGEAVLVIPKVGWVGIIIKNTIGKLMSSSHAATADTSLLAESLSLQFRVNVVDDLPCRHHGHDHAAPGPRPGAPTNGCDHPEDGHEE